jgi:hypothetical protein
MIMTEPTEIEKLIKYLQSLPKETELTVLVIEEGPYWEAGPEIREVSLAVPTQFCNVADPSTACDGNLDYWGGHAEKGIKPQLTFGER